MTVASTAEKMSGGDEPARRDMTPRYRRSRRLAVFAAAAAIGLAACGGSASSHVANLGKSGDNKGGSTAASPGTSGGRSATNLPKGNPTQLLDEWAACMRAHGDPNQADPSIDANRDIDITISPTVQGGYSGYSGEYGAGGPGLYCRAYLTAAQTALGGDANERSTQADQAKLLKFSECMRANGVPAFPDPSSGGLVLPMNARGDLNPKSPIYQNAAKLCTQKTGVHVPGSGGPPPPGLIKLDGPGSGAYSGAAAGG